MILVYEVWLCGPTDCFWWGTFLSRKHAEAWATANQEPEGFLIKEISIRDPNEGDLT